MLETDASGTSVLTVSADDLDEKTGNKYGLISYVLSKNIFVPNKIHYDLWIPLTCFINIRLSIFKT